ncbi:hypothetical protein [Nocardia gipuzkoensis]
MDTGQKHEPEGDSGSTQGPSPTSIEDDTAAKLERDIKVAARNGRHALIAALCAAIVSGAVSAGSAVYVSRNTLDRNAVLAAAQVVRADRQKAYSELLAAVDEVQAALGPVRGALSRNPTGREEARSAFVEFALKGVAALKARTMAILVGSVETSRIVDDVLVDKFEAFNADHLIPFSEQHLKPFGSQKDEDNEEMLRDSPLLVAEIDRLSEELDVFDREFIEQAHKDLGTG